MKKTSLFYISLIILSFIHCKNERDINNKHIHKEDKININLKKTKDSANGLYIHYYFGYEGPNANNNVYWLCYSKEKNYIKYVLNPIKEPSYSMMKDSLYLNKSDRIILNKYLKENYKLDSIYTDSISDGNIIRRFYFMNTKKIRIISVIGNPKNIDSLKFISDKIIKKIDVLPLMTVNKKHKVKKE